MHIPSYRNMEKWLQLWLTCHNKAINGLSTLGIAAQAFDLGADGKETSLRQVGEIQDFMSHSMNAIGTDSSLR